MLHFLLAVCLFSDSSLVQFFLFVLVSVGCGVDFLLVPFVQRRVELSISLGAQNHALSLL